MNKLQEIQTEINKVRLTHVNKYLGTTYETLDAFIDDACNPMVVDALKDTNLWLNLIVRDLAPKDYHELLDYKAEQNLDFLVRFLNASLKRNTGVKEHTVDSLRGMLSSMDNTSRMVKYMNSNIRKSRKFSSTALMKKSRGNIETLLVNNSLKLQHNLYRVVDMHYSPTQEQDGVVLNYSIYSTLEFDYTELLYTIVSYIREQVFSDSANSPLSTTTSNYAKILKHMEDTYRYNPSIDCTDIVVPNRRDILLSIKETRGKIFSIHMLLREETDKSLEEAMSHMYLLSKQMHRYLWASLKSEDLNCLFEASIMHDVFNSMERRMEQVIPLSNFKEVK